MAELIEAFARDIYNTYYPKSRSFDNINIIDIINEDIRWYLSEDDEDTVYKIEPNDTVEKIGKKIHLHILGACKDLSGTYDSIAVHILDDIRGILVSLSPDFKKSTVKLPPYDIDTIMRIEDEIREKVYTLYCKLFTTYNENNGNPFPLTHLIKNCKNK